MFGFYSHKSQSLHIYKETIWNEQTHTRTQRERELERAIIVAKDKVFFLGTLQISCIMNMQS